MLKNVQLELGMAMQVVKSNLTQSKLKSQKILKSNSLSLNQALKNWQMWSLSPDLNRVKKKNQGLLCNNFLPFYDY